MPSVGTYKDVVPRAAKRHQAAKATMKEHPDCIPFILEYAESPTITDAERFYRPRTPDHVLRGLTVGEFLLLLRRRLEFRASESLFLMVGDGELVATSDWFGKLYDESKEADGLLYLVWGKENVFG